jgi:predicted NAD-dependent protein-ADP-ribosyltransferase YbiA (DUF1768 family)
MVGLNNITAASGIVTLKSSRYPSPFKHNVTFPPSSTSSEPTTVEVTFPTAEHWMMMQKALLFKDVAVALEVLAIEGSGHMDCTNVKALGRKVKGFKEDVWVKERGESY